jgi:hypothetical protein
MPTRCRDEILKLRLGEPGGELLAAMTFLAILAYPESTSKRTRAIEAMRSRYARTVRRGSPSMTAQQQDGTLRRLALRVVKRIDAAEAARAFVHGGRQPMRRVPVRHEPARLPRARFRQKKTGMRGRLVTGSYLEPGALWTVNAWARQSLRGDWERDTWRTSRPVLHMALALLDEFESRRGACGVTDMLLNPGWVRGVLSDAESWLLGLKLAAARGAPPIVANTLPSIRLIV